ncbi:hypothetical protein MFRU_005g03140 [Monilinia fructicola]|nr:hypothetical protein MFRU_005g03140 [Monilinia fructicola]
MSTLRVPNTLARFITRRTFPIDEGSKFKTSAGDNQYESSQVTKPGNTQYSIPILIFAEATLDFVQGAPEPQNDETKSNMCSCLPLLSTFSPANSTHQMAHLFQSSLATGLIFCDIKQHACVPEVFMFLASRTDLCLMLTVDHHHD